MMTPFELGFAAHLLADWVLQTDWMAQNKRHVTHPAAWVHGLTHAVLLGLAIDLRSGIVLGALHILIDSQRPLQWWQRVVKKTNAEPEHMRQVALWLDQATHILSIAGWLLVCQWLG